MPDKSLWQMLDESGMGGTGGGVYGQQSTDTSALRRPIVVDPMQTIRGRAQYQQGIATYLRALNEGASPDEALAASGLANSAPPVPRAGGPPQAAAGAAAGAAAPPADLYQTGPAFGFPAPEPGSVAPPSPAPAIRRRGGGQPQVAAQEQPPGAGWKFQPSGPDPAAAGRRAILERLMGGVQYQRGGRGDAAMMQALQGPPAQQLTPEQERRQKREEIARALVRAFAVGMGGEHAGRALQADAMVRGDARQKQAAEAAARKAKQESDIKRAEIIGNAEQTDYERSRQQMLDALGMSKEMRELSKPQGTISVTTPDGQTIEVDADSPLVRDMYERAYPDPIERQKAMAQIGADNARAAASNAQAEVDRWSMTEQGIASKIRGRAGGMAAAGGVKVAPLDTTKIRESHLYRKRLERAARMLKMQSDDPMAPLDENAVKAEAARIQNTPAEIAEADLAVQQEAMVARQAAGGVDGLEELDLQ